MKTDLYKDPYMACVEDDRGIIAAAMRTPPFVLLLSHIVDDRAIPVIAEDVRRVYDTLVNVVGEKVFSLAFAECWQGLNAQSFHLAREQRTHKLEWLKPVQGVSGEYRLPSSADRDQLVNWLMAFANEALDGMTYEEAEKRTDDRLKVDPAISGLRLWYDGGVPVSYAGYAGPTPNGMRIGPVYTPPELRGRGYASACVAALSQELLDGGRKFCFLFTDLSNPTANHIYQTIGYEPVCDVDEYQFENKS
jgi:predicted GNAT family acetyltransferase